VNDGVSYVSFGRGSDRSEEQDRLSTDAFFQEVSVSSINMKTTMQLQLNIFVFGWVACIIMFPRAIIPTKRRFNQQGRSIFR
jgi:hypothetical protein